MFIKLNIILRVRSHAFNGLTKDPKYSLINRTRIMSNVSPFGNFRKNLELNYSSHKNLGTVGPKNLFKPIGKDYVNIKLFPTLHQNLR